MSERPVCRVCGDWVCDSCHWVRSGANRHHPHHRCHRCGGYTGHFQGIRHTNQATREEHEELADDRGWT